MAVVMLRCLSQSWVVCAHSLVELRRVFSMISGGSPSRKALVRVTWFEGTGMELRGKIQYPQQAKPVLLLQ